MADEPEKRWRYGYAAETISAHGEGRVEFVAYQNSRVLRTGEEVNAVNYLGAEIAVGAFVGCQKMNGREWIVCASIEEYE